jgi:hypothetical protein
MSREVRCERCRFWRDDVRPKQVGHCHTEQQVKQRAAGHTTDFRWAHDYCQYFESVAALIETAKRPAKERT